MGLIKQLKELQQTVVIQNNPNNENLNQEQNVVVNIALKEKTKETFFEVTVIFGDPRLGDSVKKNGVYNPEDIQTVQNLKDALQLIIPPNTHKYKFRFIDYHATLLDVLRENPPQFVLNLCDEGYQNNALRELHLPAYLEMIGIPYSGAGPTCLGLCYDKALVRAIAVSLSVPVPEESCVHPLLGDVIPQFSNFPRFIKPALGDNSIGITPGSVVHNQNDLENYVNGLIDQFPDRPVLIQEYLTGTEYGVGIVGNPGKGFIRLPILEVDFSQLDPSLPPILGYESKFIPESPYWTQINYKKANLDEKTCELLYRHAEKLFERCMCRDYARFDFRADANGTVKLLEVNPNPGWCWDGKLNKMAGFAGLQYSDLVGSIISAARRRMNLL